ncbi:hypothetical protein N7510_000953 [Penicillium lagena]|uniref:uncharacterized protein n=1 Tax=Penicillium lagena TaxID=94218 RepID=UPI002541E3CC|nr:uncharacterized protein N7510_000953 [Penicillium lagena]KAJ5624644.1 hypothetical protein N7510_000953 [Penicillium lagena]
MLELKYILDVYWDRNCGHDYGSRYHYDNKIHYDHRNTQLLNRNNGIYRPETTRLIAKKVWHTQHSVEDRVRDLKKLDLLLK